MQGSIDAGRLVGVQAMTEMVLLLTMETGTVGPGIGRVWSGQVRQSKEWMGRLVGHEMGGGETSTMACGCRQYD